jgi:hypothetical protein
MASSMGDTAANGGGESERRAATRRRWLLWSPVLLLTLLAGGWLGLKTGSLGKRAELGAGYIAHVVCSCRYVGNRDMASCRGDFEAGTEIVRVADDEARRTVTASVPLLASRVARFDPDFGCLLDAP